MVLRRQADAAIGGQRPVTRLVVRRFSSGNPWTPGKSLAEQTQYSGLTTLSLRQKRTTALMAAMYKYPGRLTMR
jgi:hypothetical protein